MIAFTPNDEQQLIIETVRRYATERVRPAAHDADESGAAPPEIIATGWELGLLPSAIPEAFGGFGDEHSAVTGALAAEELGYGDLAMALHLLAPNLFGIPILHCGTDEQKKKWLPRLTDADFVPATAALIEPRWDWNAHALGTTAERAQNSYVLNGHKAFVPLAAEAQAMLVYAREGGATQAFIVEQGASGVTVLEREKNMGLRALPTYEVKLEDVRVPREARLGGEAGCQIDLLLNYSRVGLAALAKQYADEAALFVADRAVQVLGGHGYIREHPVERWLRDARGFTTFLGMAMI